MTEHHWRSLKPTVPLQEAGVRREHDQGLRAPEDPDGQSATGRLHTAGAAEAHDASGPAERQSNVGGDIRRHIVAGQARGRLRGIHQQGERSSRVLISPSSLFPLPPEY